MSAEVNSGIILYLKHQNTLETWKNEMQDTYNLKLLQKENGVLVASGSFEEIIVFEQHLESKYMNDPSIPDQEVVSHKKQENMQTGESDTEPDVLPATTDLQAKQVTEQTNGQGYIKKHDKELNYKQGSTSEEMKENDSKYTSKCSVSINSLEIVVYEGDITFLPADCIVVHTDERSEEVREGTGLFANVACQKYRQKCLDVGDKVKGFKLCDHRIAHEGILPCKYVLHVRAPVWSKNDFTSPVLKDVVEMCLEEAARLKCLSISLPLMIPGKNFILFLLT